MMEWIPIVFFSFKGIVLVIGMFYAIKWHYDQGQKKQVTDKRTLLRISVAVALAFAALLTGLLLLTAQLSKTLGLDLTLP
ncbi:hypothetical protein ACFFKC_10710 [Pseudoduganella danionis]|uniref:DUF2909 family protein n=1 Tax=Pseudoduganella danionis TaxID=1890295 RepID=A0ABW9SKR2_9BURK|nr:hypothetical protein [Pseudoduganella danionis]MTW32506.1 hypothetical protein [Pseudoduganella danionis]